MNLHYPRLLAVGLALAATSAQADVIPSQAVPEPASITINNPVAAVANPASDAAITRRVADALERDSRIRGQVSVSTHAGVVRLSGSVESVAMIYRAIEISRAIEGVRRINDDALVSG